MRDLWKSFDNSPSSSNFLENIEYSSFNILVNYIDKIAFIFLFICFITIKSAKFYNYLASYFLGVQIKSFNAIQIFT